MNGVESSLNRVLTDFSTEMESGRPNFRKLQELMHTIDMLFHQEFSQANRRDVLDLLKDIRAEVKVLADAKIQTGKAIALFVSGLLSGIGGGYGVAGSLNGNNANLEFGKQMAQLAGAPQTGAQLFNDWKDAANTKQEALLKEIETKKGTIEQDQREHGNRADQAKQAGSEADRLTHEAINSFAQPVY